MQRCTCNCLSRLRKILERADDAANFAGERGNAYHLIQMILNKLDWNESELRAVCGALDLGRDAGNQSQTESLATLEWTRKVAILFAFCCLVQMSGFELSLKLFQLEP